jgi:hypothetical protein
MLLPESRQAAEGRAETENLASAQRWQWFLAERNPHGRSKTRPAVSLWIYQNQPPLGRAQAGRGGAKEDVLAPVPSDVRTDAELC